MVEAQNAVLCAAKSALHKPTSDGYDETKRLWEEFHLTPMSLEEAVNLCRREAVNLCRRCHRMAPFCFYNGNTFVSIIALVIRKMDLPADQAAVVRSLASHIVAGVATDLEEDAFREFCETLA